PGLPDPSRIRCDLQSPMTGSHTPWTDPRGPINWGFTPRAPLTWIKPRLGLGQYLRNMTEHLLYGTRGRVKVNFRGQPTWMFAVQQEHSRKPEEMYAVIERISSGPYLELFARRPWPGWHAWGNEIDSDITIPGYPVPSDRKFREGGAA
ncbi:MT-A70 family methyltransferase, partial [Nocardia beijingensis]|uniref:MT-A70 family methyltransferase n=1 Tax=Nocardia beijingensis TaxID=95162 RepID=UPI00345093CE